MGEKQTVSLETGGQSLTLWRLVFAAAAAWTALGAIPALVDPVASFERFYATTPSSELTLELFRGGWGQSLLFAIGYLFVAVRPQRNTALVLLGGVGKAAYALRLAPDIIAGEGTPLATVALVGDAVFVLLFAAFLVRLASKAREIPSSARGPGDS